MGAIFALEVSRLSRSSADWHRLLELCALTDVVIADEQAVYCPNDYNDRLLLGIKGQMSEAEQYWMRLRLHGGMLAKARRGELHFFPATGYVWDASTSRSSGSTRMSEFSGRLPTQAPLPVGDAFEERGEQHRERHPLPLRASSPRPVTFNPKVSLWVDGGSDEGQWAPIEQLIGMSLRLEAVRHLATGAAVTGRRATERAPA